jgi:hypothetical protein
MELTEDGKQIFYIAVIICCRHGEVSEDCEEVTTDVFTAEAKAISWINESIFEMYESASDLAAEYINPLFKEYPKYFKITYENENFTFFDIANEYKESKELLSLFQKKIDFAYKIEETTLDKKSFQR